MEKMRQKCEDKWVSIYVKYIVFKLEENASSYFRAVFLACNAGERSKSLIEVKCFDDVLKHNDYSKKKNIQPFFLLDCDVYGSLRYLGSETLTNLILRLKN